MIILLKPNLKVSIRGLLLRVAILWQRQLKFAAKLGIPNISALSSEHFRKFFFDECDALVRHEIFSDN
jgi:hypothetical protein